MPGLTAAIPSLDDLRRRTQEVFGRTPCLWQLQVSMALLKRDKDVICISAMGSGKTLTFWMPLLFCNDGIQIIISPLNILGTQNVNELAAVGIPAIAITADTATYQNFKVILDLTYPRNFNDRKQDIADLRYCVIVTNIELLMKDGGGLEKLWKISTFTAHIVSIIWDEAHCVSHWGDFRPEYRDAGRLRYLLPGGIVFYLTSATLPPRVLDDVKKILQVSRSYMFHRSNDRPNVYLMVRELKYPQNSFFNIAFLIPDGWHLGCPPPPKFLIFFDNIAESIEAIKFLRSRLPFTHQNNIKWFNADMSAQFREAETDALKASSIWGLGCTDSFGMVSPLLLVAAGPHS